MNKRLFTIALSATLTAIALPAVAQTYPANHSIHDSAQLPRPACGRITVVAANGLNSLPNLFD